MPAGLFPWLLAGWGASTFVTLVGLAVAFALPVAVLVMLLFTLADRGAGRLASSPTSYRD